MKNIFFTGLILLFGCKSEEEAKKNSILNTENVSEFILIDDSYVTSGTYLNDKNIFADISIPPNYSMKIDVSNIFVKIDCNGISWDCHQHVAKTKCLLGVDLFNFSNSPDIKGQFRSEAIDVEVSPGAGTDRPNSCTTFYKIKDLSFTYSNSTKDTLHLKSKLYVQEGIISFNHTCTGNGSTAAGGQNKGLTFRKGLNVTYKVISP